MRDELPSRRAIVKLGARDRLSLLVFAYEVWLVRPGWITLLPLDHASSRLKEEVGAMPSVEPSPI
jgi:hypothetical protein